MAESKTPRRQPAHKWARFQREAPWRTRALGRWRDLYCWLHGHQPDASGLCKRCMRPVEATP